MSSIKPFKAICYNKEKVKDFDKVVAPPYDVISEEQQTYLHNLSPYNFTHIDFGKDKPSDDKDNNKYTRAQKYFEEWLSKGILEQDQTPGIYFYKQDYKIMGEVHTRLGFISLMELDNGDTTIHPHENTHAKAVDDRLKLTKALDSNLSCIFVCYSDRQKKVEKIFQKQIVSEKPFVDVTDADSVRHRLWRLDNPERIEEINASISGQNLFIADGHHRYRVAQEYRDFRCGSRKSNSTGLEPYNYVMTYFTNLDSRDLKIFPIYRVVKHLKKDISFLEEYFRFDKVKSKEDLLILLAKAGKNEHAFGLYTKDGVRLLRLKNKLLVNKMVKEGSEDYKNLDATILKYFVFDKVGVASEDIIYTKDLKEAIDMVDGGAAEASFILNPVQIAQLKAIALNGERMPPKTTYFYPKVLSGLTIYKMD